MKYITIILALFLLSCESKEIEGIEESKLIPLPVEAIPSNFSLTDFQGNHIFNNGELLVDESYFLKVSKKISTDVAPIISNISFKVAFFENGVNDAILIVSGTNGVLEEGNQMSTSHSIPINGGMINPQPPANTKNSPFVCCSCSHSCSGYNCQSCRFVYTGASIGCIYGCMCARPGGPPPHECIHNITSSPEN